MKQQQGRQLALALIPAKRYRPLIPRPEGLVEALADLILEALTLESRDPDPQSGAVEIQTVMRGDRDEPENHR